MYSRSFIGYRLKQLSELERVFERKSGRRRSELCGKDFSAEKYFCTIVRPNKFEYKFVLGL